MKTLMFGFCAAALLACSSKGPAPTAATGPFTGPTPPPAVVPTPPVAPDAAPAKLAARAVGYGDGAGNSYALDGATLNLSYKPVTAAESSSGTYNGGAPWSHAITQAQYDALLATVDRAIAATAEQTPDRSKGTGIIRYGASQQVILNMTSPIRKALETQLKTFAP